MAHPHSVAVGGYYPTPPHLIGPIAALLKVEGRDQSYPTHQRPTAVLIDPCAGDGAAVFDLAAALWGTPLQRATGPAIEIYAVEAEQERARALRTRANTSFGYNADKHALHGDSFRVTWSITPTSSSSDAPAGAGLLWLNPPYSAEAEQGRLEDRFLRRWTAILTPGSGILVYIVPWYVLRASIGYLAQHYTDLHCFRFPADDFAAYQQVVLFATRVRHALPEDAIDDSVRERLTQWSTAPEGIPELPGGLLPHTVATFAPTTTSGLAAWQIAPIDLKEVYDLVRPWQSGNGSSLQPIPNQGLVSLHDLIGQPLPVAQPLRDVHLALALASGLLNGYQVEPDDPGSDLPPLLVKGVFEREFRTTEEKTNKDGEVTALIQVQQPKMRVCVLDLESYTYHELAPGAVPTGIREIGAMNIADLIAQYGYGLGRIMAQQCPPLHHPAAAAEQLLLPPLHRTPFPAQVTTIQVLLKLLWTGENPFLIGEVGVGKSLITLATAAALAPAAWSDTTEQLRNLLGPSRHPHLRPVKHVLIVCPPHLLASWCTQVALTVPGAQVVVLEAVQQLEPVQGPQPDLPGQGLTFFLLSRETGKLGSQLASGMSDGRCPRCFQPVALTTDEIISQRRRCTARRQLPTNAQARLTIRLAQLLLKALPENALVRSFVRSRMLLKQAARQRARYTAIRDPEQRLLVTLDEWYARALGEQKTPLLGSPLGRLMGELETLVMDELQARAAQALLQRCLPLVRPHWPGLVGLWCQWTAAVLVLATPATAREDPGVLPLIRVMGLLWWSVDDPERDGHLARWIEAAYEWTVADTSDYGGGSRVRRELRLLLITLQDSELRDTLCRRLSTHPVDKGYGTSTPWTDFNAVLAKLDRLRPAGSVGHARPVGAGTPETIYYASQTYTVSSHTGTLSWNDAAFGTPTAARLALDELRVLGTWRMGPVCHEPLFQVTPQPRRFPLATFIARYRRSFFQLLIIDEAHEYKTQNSAQERAAHRLTELPLPTILASGSFMSGYVRSVHANCWAVSHGYRQEFGREDATALITRYGYRKVLVEVSDKQSKEAVNYGRTTDRITTADTVQRNLGEAPGMLPVFLLKHILNRSAMIHKADLHADLPGCTETPVPITVAGGDTVGQQLLEHYAQVQRAIIEQIKRDRWDAGRVGKLWGAMSELPSLLDRLHTDTGNDGPVGKRCYSVRYPPSLNDELVATALGFAPGLLLPKEQWLLELLTTELAAGRNVLVFVWHTGKGSGLVEHLHRMIRHHFGDITITLDATKVKTSIRERWIDEQVVAPGKRVLLVNPTTVQTGLNNLVHFATAIWWENPQCDAVIYRQANGRLDRLGQRQPVRILFPYYKDTAQELMLDLLGRKIAASLQLDGLNVVSALEAVGAEHAPVLQTLEIGRAIYERLLETSGNAASVGSVV